MTTLNTEHLNTIFPHAGERLIALYHQPLLDAMEKAEINTPLRQAHFLAQIGHESGDLRFTRELGNDAYFVKYDGRKDLGNVQPGDGARFKGRGLIQLTGRTNYAAYGAAIGQDLVNTPGAWEKVATDPDLAVGVATWFWTKRLLNHLADEDLLRDITHKINGGYNGLEDRQAHLDRAKTCLGC